MGRTDGQNFGWWSSLCRALAGFFLKMIPAGEAFDQVLYRVMAPFVTSIMVEVVISRRGEKGGLEVWLEKHNQGNGGAEVWSCPGEILRPGEQVGDTLGRVIDRIGQGQVRIARFEMMGGFYHWIDKRWCFTQPVAVQLSGTLQEISKWHATSLLPPGVRDYHRQKLIPLVIQRYLI